MGEAVARAVTGRHHPHHLRRSVPDGYQGLSRAEGWAGTGITPVFPLWERPHARSGAAMIASGFETYLATVDLKKLAGGIRRPQVRPGIAGRFPRRRRSLRREWRVFIPVWWQVRSSRAGSPSSPASALSGMVTDIAIWCWMGIVGWAKRSVPTFFLMVGTARRTRLCPSYYAHARKVPPIFFVTSATILARDRVDLLIGQGFFSRGWMVTAMATDFLASSMPLPS